MTILIVFAFLSGIVTILSPCILPVLPIVLSGSVGGKSRPYGVVIGFVASFSIFTLALSHIVRALHLPPDILRITAVVLIVAFGLVMVSSRLRGKIELFASRITSSRRSGSGGMTAAGIPAGAPPRRKNTGFSAGILTGVSLGLVWTPCVGPILASVISLAVTRSVDGGAVLIILAYSLGTAIPMLAVMLGGRGLIHRFPALQNQSDNIQRIFGILMIMVGIGIGFELDRRFQTSVLSIFPNYGSGLTALENIEPVRDAIDARRTGGDGNISENAFSTDVFSLDEQPEQGKLGNYGPAPPLITDGMWFNSAGHTMEDLRGKVVLIDFWTYSCVNCIRTIPHLSSWYEAYRKDGFVIIGVHTPEFAFEQDPDNVRRAIAELGVTWPVVLDNQYVQWEAYRNRFWPAHYFIDTEGRIRYFQFGEGEYDIAEGVIRRLLEEAGNLSSGRAEIKADANLESRTPETYLGYRRSQGFISQPKTVRNRPAEYSPAAEPGNGEWSLQGTWTITAEYITPVETGELEVGFNARNVFLVIEPADEDGLIEVRLDGRPIRNTPDVRNGIIRPDESRLYQLVELDAPERHTLSLTVHGHVRLFAFTFG